MRACKMLLTGCCFLACSIIVCGTTLAQSETAPPDGKIGFALAELDDGKIKLDFGSNGTHRQVTTTVAQTYTVAVPYTEKVMQDGKEVNVTRMRTETRTRMVPVTRTKLERFESFELDKASFFNSNGEKVEAGEVKSRLETKQAIVVLPAGKKLDEFYMSVLRDDVLVISLPTEKEGGE